MLNNGIEKNQMYDFRRLLFWGGKGLQNIQNFTADSKHLNIRRSVLNLMEGVRQQRLLCFTGDLSYSSWGGWGLAEGKCQGHCHRGRLFRH